MPYLVLDEGLPFMDDEPVAIGPFDTEDEAVKVADGRRVIALLSPAEFAESEALEGDDEDDDSL